MKSLNLQIKSLIKSEEKGRCNFKHTERHLINIKIFLIKNTLRQIWKSPRQWPAGIPDLFPTAWVPIHQRLIDRKRSKRQSDTKCCLITEHSTLPFFLGYLNPICNCLKVNFFFEIVLSWHKALLAIKILMFCVMIGVLFS